MVTPGRMVVITGATGGIGAAIARAVHRRGGVAVLACHPSTFAEGHALSADIPESLVLPVDVADTASVRTFAREITRYGTGIEGLVNNAGVLVERSFEDLDEQTWARVIDVNLSGTFRMVHALRQALSAGEGGSVVNIASQLAYTGAPNVAAYAASKGGVLGLTRALAHDLAPKIRVNAVAPGPIESPMNTPYMSDQQWVARKVGKSVMGRFGTADEVAGAVLYLLSPEATFFTGQTLSPNGGGVMP
ncbi:SDR family NAD(P)-dependent oxidoreductase [Mycolicibacterium tokaiense]|uniref:Short-chain dehydrogenase n=1 Tax=Mycolicibacterium tokaiense TaxID=39695 RepID=A0A378TJ12_9MYCO|nr:SDR family oxidoreductase [Mycolicibacterium tokaiense]BBY85694.1 3-oxoacyl-ACP reductase [Mycolicibacterium tokaiense]STZ59793.1 short-chain dehydrogenase [Mycolicibacterium tokaiense]